MRSGTMRQRGREPCTASKSDKSQHPPHTRKGDKWRAVFSHYAYNQVLTHPQQQSLVQSCARCEAKQKDSLATNLKIGALATLVE
ncbi:unnamed protein product [Cochlearia groenlandica]